MTSLFITDHMASTKARVRYEKRRQTLMQSIKSLMIFYSFEEKITPLQYYISVHEPFYQDPLFLYLTGLLQRGSALILDPFSKETVLFLPPYDAHKVFWEGEQLGHGLKNIEEITGIPNIFPMDFLFAFLEERLKQQKTISTFWNEGTQDIHYHFLKILKQFLKKKAPHISIENCSEQIWPHRLILDEQDYKVLKIAHQKTALAFEKFIRHFHEFKTENQAAGFLEYAIKEQTPFGCSFPTICASGKNACVLHYHDNNAPLNGLLLLDFGLRYESKVTDISRTLPVNRSFNALEALLYDLVLETQYQVQKKVRPGVLLSELNIFAWETLNTLIERHFLKRGGVWHKVYKSGPHYIGHAIGTCVHEGDFNRNYALKPLKPGMLISNEPGIYGHFDLKIGGKSYSQHSGIRIEDNLWINQEGCENLSRAIPKDRNALFNLLNTD